MWWLFIFHKGISTNFENTKFKFEHYHQNLIKVTVGEAESKQNHLCLDLKSQDLINFGGKAC